MSFLIVHPNFDELVNAVNLREKKNLPAAKDFHGVLILRGLGPSEATTHFRTKERTVLLDEPGPIEIFAAEPEREFGHIGYGRLVVARHSRFELEPEGVEFRTGLGRLALTRYLAALHRARAAVSC